MENSEHGDNKMPAPRHITTHWLALAAVLFTTLAPPAIADVSVAQTPLTKPASIKPNVMLILDDSGSMAWSVMPDSPSNTDADEGLISPSVNGVYYNPTTEYEPPYTETAHPNAETPTTTRYTASSFSSAWSNGFNQSGGTYNIATYKGDDDSSPVSCGRNCTVLPAFSHTFRIVVPDQYAFTANTGCPSGYSGPQTSGSNRGLCIRTVSETPQCQGYGGYSSSSNRCNTQSCGFFCSFRPDPCGTPNNSAGTSLNGSTDKCEGTLAVDPNCPSGYSINPETQGTSAPNCRKLTAAGSTKYRSLFVYAIKNSDGTYTRRYVGAASEDTSSNGSANTPRAGNCASIAAGSIVAGTTVYRINNSDQVQETLAGGLPADQCDANASTRQNVANWFSYYRTRILMAKSGLMNAFATLDENVRFGFGSIDGNNNGNIPSPYTSGSPRLAKVKPFGNGDSNTRRKQFWSWVSSSSANSGTPLRTALKATGDYYSNDDQPWVSGDNAPECVDKSADCSTQMLACRQSYTILTTDGFWNSDDITMSGYGGNWDGGPGSETQRTQQIDPSCSSNYPNLQDSGTYAGYCRKGTGRGSNCNSNSSQYRSSCFTEGSCNSPYSYNSSSRMCERQITTTQDTITNTGPNGLEYIYTAVPPYSGGQALDGSSTLADIASYYWLNDLRSDLTNSVPTNTDDPAFWQHMTTFTVGLFDQDTSFSYVRTDNGNSASTTPESIFAWAKGGSAIPAFSWPTPSGAGNGISANISDLIHAGLNGHGGFYAAGNPDAFASGIQDALQRVSQRVGSGASLAANSTKLDTGTTAYQAVYYTGDWRGDLKALPVSSDGTTDTENPSWQAINRLPSAAARAIKTCTGNCTGSETFVDFSTSATFDSKSELCADPDACISGEANEKIDYLRGSSVDEQRNSGTYRNRTTPLGDIVDSQPVFVGSPNAKLYAHKSFADSYATFADTDAVRARRKLIYVAANDGMLHAFNAEATDSTPTVNTTESPRPGREMFAYLPKAVIKNGLKNLSRPNYGDPANPHQYYNDGELTVADVQINDDWKTVLIGTTGRGPAKAVYAFDVTDPANISLLWERSAADSDYIGEIVGKPVIARVPGGSWVALMGNGYNSTYGQPALLQFDLATGALSAYTTSGVSNDGLAQPAVWISDDTLVDNISTQAYAGDLHGNIWAFDLDADGGTGTKIFVAKKGSTTQPITAGLVIAKNSDDDSVWAFFGTGSFLSQFEVGDGVQTWYGLIVQGANKVSSTTTRTELKQRSIVAENVASDGRLASRGIPPATDGDMGGDNPPKGWYIDLLPPSGTAQGERMVTPNQFQGALLVGTSRLPTGNSDPCNPSGAGWIMAVNPFTGTPETKPFFDINNDGAFTNDAGGDNTTKDNTQYQNNGDNVVAAGVGFSSIPNNPIFVGQTMLISFDNATTGKVNTRKSGDGVLRRLSWREMVTQ